ncbi:hypothetical protein BS78_06G161300 [Paspalum vaginatum]|nr:hypothetical protein BS78_06G161300 [Paspalum vaginatum]
MSVAAACAPPPRVGMFTFGERMAPPPPPPPDRPEGAESCVDPQLWLACAGSMCTVPPVGAAVYYFPQGHAEQASAAVDLSATRVPPLVPCRVLAVRFMAEPETDDVFARIRLVPLRPGEPVVDVGDADALGPGGGDDGQPKTASFAKTLTQSDASNGSGFSVPRFCAETIFPGLDYRLRPPVQSVYARDVHGVDWTFRHIYRGTPRRHLLTTGWSNFVTTKKLLPGDNVVFLRGEDGGIHVGLRRTKRGSLSRWDAYGKVQAADVAAAATLAAAGEPFEVVYYPRASSPGFCVRAAAVRASMQVQWTSGLRFKMAFETEDASRISWFMGAIAGVQPADPARWPRSPWRLLQVTWEEPELLRNVHRVSPWLVEPVSSMPNLHMPPPFSAPRKKPRIPPYNNESILLEGQQLFDTAFPPNHPLPPAPSHGHGFTVPSFPFPEYGSAAAGIQGARQAQFVQILSDPHISNLQRSLLFGGGGISPAERRAPPTPRISTDLIIGSALPSSPPAGAMKGDDVKPAGRPGVVMLFGRAILTEEQMKSGSSGVPSSPRAINRGSFSNTSDGSGSDVTQVSPTKTNLPSWMPPWSGDSSPSEWGLEAGQCKVFVESDAVGRNLDLSALGSFEELYARLSAMFRIDSAACLGSHVVYLTAAGEAKHVGDEPFSAFVKSARRITILSDAGSDNTGNV